MTAREGVRRAHPTRARAPPKTLLSTPPDTSDRHDGEGFRVETVAVLGAGTMGHGIAQVAALAGYRVVLRDVDREALARAVRSIEANLDKGIQRGKVTDDERDGALQRLRCTTSLEEAARADLFVEAAPERMELKQSILREVEAAAELLREDFGVSADIWSAPSFTELRREGMATERFNRLHPLEERRIPYVERLLADRPGPVIAATDYMRAFPDQIRPYVPKPFHVLGTDGFGRSDYRKTLRSFFEVDRHHVAVTALFALAEAGEIDAEKVAEAIDRYGIDAGAEAPWRR